MYQREHILKRVVVYMVLLVISTALWLSLGTLAAYALPCGTNCENTTNSPSVSLTLNGSDQTVSYTMTFSLNNISTLGWNVTITSTQFATGATPVRTLATTASSITGVTAVCSSGQVCTSLPQNVVTYPIAVPAANSAPSPVKFYDAQNLSGVGAFDISTTVAVTVPANAYAGTYTSTLTLAYVSGP